MKFAYSTVISKFPGSNDYVLLRRPEIPVTIVGPAGELSLIGLVDTGSDNTIFPHSVADLLQISTSLLEGAGATAFGGQRVELQIGDAVLRLHADDGDCAWKSQVCFYDFPSTEDDVVILGHAGFLDYFTATFDGKEAVLTLLPNDQLPS
jgi:hypothetical protein